MNEKKKGFGINKYWLLLVGGIVSLIIGGAVAVIWQSMPENQAIGMCAVVLIIAGIVLIWRQIKHRHDVLGGGVEVNITETVMDTKQSSGKNIPIQKGRVKPNCIVIEAKTDEASGKVMPVRVAFDSIYEPKGQPIKVLNFNEYYYVQLWDITKKSYVPFILPDRKFTDPAIMARYLSLPAQRKYLRHRESLMRFVGPGLLAVGVVVEFIAIIALAG